jgi:hypothetical protein
MSKSDQFTCQRPYWLASYHVPTHARYVGNPLIEALPEPYTSEQALHFLRLHPTYEDAWRNKPSRERLEVLLSLADFFQPLTQHLDLEQRFSRMLRHGYISRNPLEQGYWAQTREQCKAMAEFVPGAMHQGARAQGFTLLGISGIGKSRALERILSLYPQVILHEAFAGKRFTWVQLVWLKLDCPQDGSLKGLCQGFFEEVDAILGTNYYATYALHGRASTDQMLVSMARVARLHSLGTLVIDELQNLRQATGNMAERVLNFFVQLDNTIGVPVILKSQVPRQGWFRYCPQCVEEDRALYGECYWHRLHQINGVLVCPKHHLLLESCSPDEQDQALQKFIPADLLLPSGKVRSSGAIPAAWVVAERLATQIAFLLDHPQPGIDLYQRYRLLLEQHQYLRRGGAVRIKKVIEAFEEMFPPSLLQALHCQWDPSLPADKTWLNRIVGPRTIYQHPLQHVLMITFLQGSIEEFFRPWKPVPGLLPSITRGS